MEKGRLKMPINRFYINAPLIEGETISLEETEHHHLSHVMKLSENEEIELINGQGVLSIGKIVQIKKRNTSILMISSKKTSAPTPSISLAIPLMRPSKLEWIIEKGVELGADAFFFFKADHSEKENLSEHQLERLRSISIAACKQSGRLYLPSFEVLCNLETLFEHDAIYLFGDTRTSSCHKIPVGKSLIFMSGPEKGFSPQELQLLSQKGISFSLSPNILRAETAPIAAISILKYLILCEK